MTLPRILSAVGRALAILGVVILLFVVFQLWGTGLQQAQAQSGLEDDLSQRIRLAALAGQAPRQLSRTVLPGAGDAGEVTPITTEAAADATGDEGSAAAEDVTEVLPAGDAGNPGGGEGPATSDESALASGDDESFSSPAEPRAANQTLLTSLPEYPADPHLVRQVAEPAVARTTARLLHPEVEEMLRLIYPADGEAIARIIIPSIDVDEIVVAGVGVEDLRKGPGHYSTTPLPGQPGNAALAGHRTTYGAPFGRLAELSAGDVIIVETVQGKFEYRVLPGQTHMAGQSPGFQIVAPTALEVLEDMGDNRLTLTSCHPKYSSRQRIIVHAVLVGDPVVRLPRPGEPIGGEHVQLAESEEPPAGNSPTTAAQPADDLETPGTNISRSDADLPEVAAPDTTLRQGTLQELSTPQTSIPQTTPAPTVGEEPAQATVPSTASATVSSSASTAAPTAEAFLPEQVTPVTEEGFGEGLSGDRGAILPAVLWGLAALAVWLLARHFGRSGRRILRYSVSAVAFLVVLYLMFSYVDRALPAY